MSGNATNSQAPLYLNPDAVKARIFVVAAAFALSVAYCVRVCKQRCKKNTENTESAESAEQGESDRQPLLGI